MIKGGQILRGQSCLAVIAVNIIMLRIFLMRYKTSVMI